jgi:predicted enzyme related to lactoylglutathione lyase
MTSRASQPVVHLELHTPDREAAARFYADLCRWAAARVETRAGTYEALDLGRDVSGGIIQCPTPRSLWLPYVQVEQIGTATERARELGARVMLEPREGPAGWRSVVSTPAAGEVALWQQKR